MPRKRRNIRMLGTIKWSLPTACYILAQQLYQSTSREFCYT